jgi:hypothetical protein
MSVRRISRARSKNGWKRREAVQPELRSMGIGVRLIEMGEGSLTLSGSAGVTYNPDIERMTLEGVMWNRNEVEICVTVG